MYRILIADDEGIMLYSLKKMIQKEYGEACEVETAKTGRAAVAMTHSFQPDIVFMDIQMPGMNGIEAMQLIRQFNTDVIFIVITAYSQFDYAKEAIEIGVLDFLSKPLGKERFIKAMDHAISQLKKRSQERLNSLRIREKLDIVVPMMENGFINYMLFQEGKHEKTYYNYKELLDIQQNLAHVLLIQFGEAYEDRQLTNPVGMSMRAEKFYPLLRQLTKEKFNCLISGVMANKIVVIVLEDGASKNHIHESKNILIQKARELIMSLEELIDAKFRVGIGKTYPLRQIHKSYWEGLHVLQECLETVGHVIDYSQEGNFEDDYPEDREEKIFEACLQGDVEGTNIEASLFFEWMVDNYCDYRDCIQLKVLELVMRVETEAFWKGALNYSFLNRKDYLGDVIACKTIDSLRQWWLSKWSNVARAIAKKENCRTSQTMSQAIDYLEKNYRINLSLDDVARKVNINPYYFSKRFKEETGVNFIDYLTDLRLKEAKRLLKESKTSIKEIGLSAGYSDPNYFSRLFKKNENMTPSEFREKCHHE